jgi:hypothetical protein
VQLAPPPSSSLIAPKTRQLNLKPRPQHAKSQARATYAGLFRLAERSELLTFFATPPKKRFPAALTLVQAICHY